MFEAAVKYLVRVPSYLEPDENDERALIRMLIDIGHVYSSELEDKADRRLSDHVCCDDFVFYRY